MKSKTSYDFCLPAPYATWNLLPEVRDRAVLFAELGIPWHQGIEGGPGNHLLSSQVQCVNAVGKMVDDAARIRRAFGQVMQVGEVLEIEPGRLLTFDTPVTRTTSTSHRRGCAAAVRNAPASTPLY